MPEMTSAFTREFNTVFAAAYRDAALQEADMTALAAVLEPIRREWKETDDTLVTRAALDTAVGGNEDPNAESALVQLRADFAALQQQIWLTELRQSPDKAWAYFLDRYASALYFWRTQLMWWWADAAAREPVLMDKSAELQRFREQSRLIEHGRWPEAYPFLRALADEALLQPRLRAQLRTVCGSIQMHYNTLPDARTDLAEAQKLFPDLPYLPVCSADLERVAGNIATSRDLLEKHLVAYPKDPEAHIAMGRSFSEENNLDEAERWFQKAIEADPGNASAYRSLMTLLAKNEESFQKNRDRIAELHQLADRADPESALSNLLEAGYAFQSGGDPGAAADCFEKARQIEPERPEPLVAAGYLHQLQQQPREARSCFETVLRLAPGAVDGYWNLAALSAEQGQWASAAEWYEKALPHCPMFTRTLLVKAGEMYIALGDFDKGKASCLQALELDPGFDFAINTLHDLSDKLRDKGYSEKTGGEPAIAVLRDIRRIKGDAYEANFLNRTGNVYYYFADYPPAAEHYRKAIAADGSIAVYHDNLAGTLDKISDAGGGLETLEEALQAAQNAARLDPANEAYRQQVARFQRKLVSLRHFGVAPDERSANIYSIRVRFRDELYPSFVKDDNLAPELLQKIEDMREKFRKAFGIALPGVRFSTDWNIVEGANFVIDFEGIPLQQGWLIFGEEAAENPFDTLMALLEQNILYNLADFIRYDSPEISAKFVGKSAAYASGFFQLVRMLLKQKISVEQIDAIHECYESGMREHKTVQAIAEAARRHPAILPGLPINGDAHRSLQHLSADQEEAVLSSVGKSSAGQLLWQIHPEDPVFYSILEYLPKTEFALGGEGHYASTRYPQVATLLNDLSPGTFFGRDEILHLSEAEKAALPHS